MKKILKSYQFWLIVSITILITLIAICITFAANYYELEGYRNSEFTNQTQTTVINELKDQNAALQTEKQAAQSSDTISTLIEEYVKAYYYTDGTESENEKAMKVEKYVTNSLFEQMYNEMESKVSYAPDERIPTVPKISNTMYEIEKDGQTAKSLSLVDIIYYYPLSNNDTQTILLQMDFVYDNTEKLWKISGVSTANVKMNQVWG